MLNIDNLTNAKSVLSQLSALPFQDKDQLPSSSGIYFVTLLNKEIIYIGKTKNFNTRWIAHHKLNDIRERYDVNDILIAYGELASDLIDQAEAVLIQKHMPELNIIMMPGKIKSQAKKWHNSKKPSSTDIPRDLRLWVHKKCGCTCQVCGVLVNDNHICIVKYHEETSDIEGNLALICRSCRSKMRSNKSISEFRESQKALMIRDVEKLKVVIDYSFPMKCAAIDELAEFIISNKVVFKYGIVK